MSALRLLVAEGNVASHRENVKRLTGRTPSGTYAAVLKALAPGAEVDIVYPADPGANLPGAALADYDGVAITGSALNIYTLEDASLAQIEFARAIFAAGIPFFGSCWGLQVATVAAGGSVRPNPKGREVGFARHITLTSAGAAHPLHAGRSSSFDAPAVHMDEVADRPHGMTVTATNAVSDVQAAEIRHGNGVFWGVQYHPEYDFTDIVATLERYRPILLAEGLAASEDDIDRLTGDLTALSAAPTRRDIAWRYGLGPSLTEPGERLTELRNWIEAQVRPAASARGRA